MVKFVKTNSEMDMNVKTYVDATGRTPFDVLGYGRHGACDCICN